MYCTVGIEIPQSHTRPALMLFASYDLKISSFQHEARIQATTQHGFFPDGENFPVNP